MTDPMTAPTPMPAADAVRERASAGDGSGGGRLDRGGALMFGNRPFILTPCRNRDDPVDLEFETHHESLDSAQREAERVARLGWNVRITNADNGSLVEEVPAKDPTPESA